MAISLTFDTAAEAGAFFAMFTGHPGELISASIESIGFTGEAATRKEGDSLVVTPSGNPEPITGNAEAPAGANGKPVSPEAKAVIDSALAVAAASKAAKAAEGAKTPAPKGSKKAAPAAAADPVPAKAGQQEELLVETPAASAGTPAATQPTATAAPEQPASSNNDASFFGSTNQDASAKDAPKIYTEKEVVDALMAWSKRVDQNTFGAVMVQIQVKNVAELKAKPEVWSRLMAIVEDSNKELDAVAAAAAQ
jgi:hypothetical protein